MEEIKYVRGIIEHDAKTEFGGILERLKSNEGTKLSILQHKMAEIQKDADSINQLLEAFTELTKDGADPLAFMLKNGVFRQNIEYLIEKPFLREIGVTPYDLPRELAKLRSCIEEVESLEKLSNFKSEIICSLHNETKKKRTQVSDELNNAVKDEIGEWAALAERYSSELSKF